MLLDKNVCEKLAEYFGRYYDATIDRIDGVNTPVHYNGGDYTTLVPKDTDKSWAYIRETNPASVSMVDLGGCELTPFITENYRFVAYSKKPFEPYVKLQQFLRAMRGYDIQLSQVITNIEQVYNQEVGGKKHPRLKNIGYMAIDFSITDSVSTCDTPDC